MGNKHMERCSIPLYNIVKLKNKIKFKKKEKSSIYLLKEKKCKSNHNETLQT